jgi:hypothetical protein
MSTTPPALTPAVHRRRRRSSAEKRCFGQRRRPKHRFFHASKGLGNSFPHESWYLISQHFHNISMYRFTTLQHAAYSFEVLTCIEFNNNVFYWIRLTQTLYPVDAACSVYIDTRLLEHVFLAPGLLLVLRL